MTATPHGRALLGLVGAGIGGSLTPALHEAEAAQHGLRLHYQLIDLDVAGVGVEALPTLLAAARWMGFAGLNITYPCKQAVLPLLDELSVEARSIGAVNTVVIRDGRTIGCNTDVSGWSFGFRRHLGDADLSRVVLLGAGGAGSAIACGALQMGVRELVIVDCEPARARALADRLGQFHGAHRVTAEDDVARALAGAAGLIHATPTGMAKSPGLPLPAALLRSSLWVSEIVYFPLETELVRAARAAGCRVSDGGGMAVGQAVGAFRLFTGCTPDATRMERHFRTLLEARDAAHRSPPVAVETALR